jgi:sugar porter (SP) family MFS transporter
MYIAEILPARIRGRLVSVNQFAIVSGILVVYFVNYFIAGYGAGVDRRMAARLIAHHGSTIDAEFAGAFLAESRPNLQNRLTAGLLAGPTDGLNSRSLADFMNANRAPDDPRIEPAAITLAFHGELPWNVRRGWRWMFGSEALPALMLLAFLLGVPESPRWLAKQGRRSDSLAILSRVGGPNHARLEFAEIEKTIAEESGSLAQLLQPGMQLALIIGVTLAILQQVTGINVFLYYGPEIFKNMGTTIDAALLQTILVGAVNVTFTIIAIWTVDRLGRKPLMLVGYTGMGLSLLGMGLAAYFQRMDFWVLVFILGYIACFALSVGPVTWVILSEIFPTKIRGRAMAIATVCLWVANYVVTQTFTLMDEDQWLKETFHHAFPFWIYAVLCTVAVVFLARFVPETKGKTLEEIERSWMQLGPAK